jgi:hypothetical protein
LSFCETKKPHQQKLATAAEAGRQLSESIKLNMMKADRDLVKRNFIIDKNHP